MTHTPTTAELPATISDETADAILWTLQDNGHRDFTPSEMARKAKTDPDTARTVLQYLAATHSARTTGNGAWTRWSKW